MAKQRNQLYQNPDKVFAHEAGATVHIIQPIKFNGRKICTPMFIAHDFYRGLSSDYEKAADERNVVNLRKNALLLSCGQNPGRGLI
jgi:hypothetical protein